MEFDFLPDDIHVSLKKLNVDKLTELRLRIGYPVLIFYDNKRRYLSVDHGVVDCIDMATVCFSEHINFIINKVCEYSIYAHNDKICNGYLTTPDGIRIGVAGECVFNKEKIVTIKNISSLNIRVPHEITGCCDNFFSKLFNDDGDFLNTLIISPPFCGKTTMLKDLAKKMDRRNAYSILIIDERGEFNRIKGENIDVIKFSNKFYAFEYGLRSLSPNLVITDELITREDWLCVKNAVNSGVKIIASVHADSINSVVSKNHFINNLFDRYILLDSKKPPGVIKGVYDKNCLQL